MKSNYSVKEIQNEMLVLLKKFHSLCVTNKINYSVHAGTMIGIVREKGFIPWDDDADISFTRKEFEKLEEVLRHQKLADLLGCEEGTSYFYSEHDNAFPQLWMKRENKPAVWLDFFIYDFISENRLVQKIKFFNIAILLGILKNKDTMELTKKRGTFSGPRFALIYIAYIFGKMISEERKYKLADIIRKSFPGSRKMIHRSNDRYIGVSFVYPKSIMEDFILMPFEDTELMVTTAFKDILIPSYGEDYMTPKKDDTSLSDVHALNRDKMPKFSK